MATVLQTRSCTQGAQVRLSEELGEAGAETIRALDGRALQWMSRAREVVTQASALCLGS